MTWNNRNPQPDTVSLLWHDIQDSYTTQPEQLQTDDLRVKVVADTISQHPNYTQFIYQTLLTLLTDTQTITYRHEILDDCLAHNDFTAGLSVLLPMMRGLHEYVSDIRARRNEISVILTRLTELEKYVDCVQALYQLLQQFRDQLQADAWNRLYQKVEETILDPLFSEMANELPQLRANVREIVSVSIGVNLSPDLKPIGVTLLSLNSRRFQGPRFFRKLWGIDEDADVRGMTPLREAPESTYYFRDSVFSERRDTLDKLAANVLFTDLGKLLNDVVRPIGNALQKYTRMESGFLRYIEPEIAFYVGSVKLIQRLREHGLSVTKPTILPMSDRHLNASNLYNLDLALRLLNEHKGENLSNQIVGNDVCFDDAGRIQILTGPNRGGKTTYTQSIGLLHVMAQSGLYVPADNVSISPVDGVYLHFPAEEDPTMESGRLGEEAKRLRDIFSRATSHSLILLNESLASTSASESYYLARDVVSCLRMLSTRAVFVTHLHELAEHSDDINAEVEGNSTVQSVVSITEEDENGVQRTYKVIPAPPRGRSYAREIARQYGISFDQIQSLLNDRDLLNGS